MLSKHTPYFAQTEQGESRWWSWLIAFWFTIVGWIVGQSFLAGPIPNVVQSVNPELSQRYIDASIAMFENIDLGKMALFTLMTVGSAILTAICWAINRYSQDGARKLFGWMTGIFCALSVIGAAKLLPMLNDPSANALLLEMVGASPLAYALMLATFPALLVGLFLVQKFIHKRTVTSLHTSAQNFDFKRVFYAIAVTWAVLGSVTLILHVTGLSPVRNQFDPSRFFAFALVTLIFIPLQSGTEEIVFRGYLNQGFGHFISNKWVVFFITSALFASMHLANPEAQAGAEEGGLMHLLVMSHYFMFGFILSVIVYFEDGLEAAIGLHAGNNMFAAMFVNYEGSALPTPSAFIAGINPDIDIPVGILTIALIAWILYRSRPNKALTLA